MSNELPSGEQPTTLEFSESQMAKFPLGSMARPWGVTCAKDTSGQVGKVAVDGDGDGCNPPDFCSGKVMVLV